jgi:hypothetical protein
MEDKQVQSESKKHHKAESETTNGAPDRPEFFQNRAPASQSESTNEAPESTIKDHKRRNKKSAKKIFQTFPFRNCFNWPSYPAIAVLLCTTTLAQSTSQYLFVLHKALLSTFSTTKLAQATSQ